MNYDDYPLPPLPYQWSKGSKIDINETWDPERYDVDWISASPENVSSPAVFVAARSAKSYHFFEMNGFQAHKVLYARVLQDTGRDARMNMEDFIDTVVKPNRKQWGHLVKWCQSKNLFIFVPLGAV